MSESGEPRIARVCVALQAACSVDDALAAAASLAAELDAELAAFFMEDVNILRAAALSFTREMGLASGVSRPMQLADVERALRAQAQTAQSALAQLAEDLQLRWSFTTVRGADMAAVPGLAEDMSLIVMAPRSALTDARAPSSRGTRKQRRPPARPVTALYEGSKEGLQAVQLAAQLSRSRAAPLAILFDAGAGLRPGPVRERVEKTDAQSVPGVRYVALADASPGRTAAAAREANAALLVVGSSAQSVARQKLSELLAHVDCPLIVVGAGPMSGERDAAR